MHPIELLTIGKCLTTYLLDTVGKSDVGEIFTGIKGFCGYEQCRGAREVENAHIAVALTICAAATELAQNREIITAEGARHLQTIHRAPVVLNQFRPQRTGLHKVYLAHITLDGLRTHSYYHPLVGAESVESVGVVIGIALAIPSEVAMQCGVGASIHDEYVGIGFASLGSHDDWATGSQFALYGVHPRLAPLKTGEEFAVEDMHILVISEILFEGGDDTVEFGGCRGLCVFRACRTTAVNHELCHGESLVVGDGVGVLGEHPVVFIVIAEKG